MGFTFRYVLLFPSRILPGIAPGFRRARKSTLLRFAAAGTRINPTATSKLAQSGMQINPPSLRCGGHAHQPTCQLLLPLRTVYRQDHEQDPWALQAASYYIFLVLLKLQETKKSQHDKSYHYPMERRDGLRNQ
jgi:hypothetical protein